MPPLLRRADRVSLTDLIVTKTGDSWLTEFHGDAANIVSNGCAVCVNGAALTGTN